MAGASLEKEVAALELLVRLHVYIEIIIILQQLQEE